MILFDFDVVNWTDIVAFLNRTNWNQQVVWILEDPHVGRCPSDLLRVERGFIDKEVDHVVIGPRDRSALNLVCRLLLEKKKNTYTSDSKKQRKVAAHGLNSRVGTSFVTMS